VQVGIFLPGHCLLDYRVFTVVPALQDIKGAFGFGPYKMQLREKVTIEPGHELSPIEWFNAKIQ
jgi:hypothetical protein